MSLIILFIFSLKRLQVIDMIYNFNIFNKHNISVPADDFLEVANQFQKQFINTSKPLHYSFRKWQEQFVSEILTPFGLCFTFNAAQSHDLLNIESTSSDFHYQLFELRYTKFRMSNIVRQVPETESREPGGLYMFHEIRMDTFKPIISKDNIGYPVFLHDPFELPTQFSKIFLINSNEMNAISIDVQINDIDDSIVEYDPFEYVET